MLSVGRTIGSLARYRKKWERFAGAVQPVQPVPAGADRLTEVARFGLNPGNLRMFVYVPQVMAPKPALVIVLHGCKQNAAVYDHGAGWSRLADRYGFVLVFPQQQQSNNPNNCFNWFQSRDTTRGRGEAASIRQMVQHAAVEYGADPQRIFVTGLSAGGAMTAVMLATYPDVFAGGAIIAGLPFGTAGNVAEAFESMFQVRPRSGRDWGDLVRGASPHRGPWPTVSIWHGAADQTVKPQNAEELVKQWADVHGLDSASAQQRQVNGYPHSAWRDASGREVMESYTITGMGHGTPLATKTDGGYGSAGPFMLEAGIASSYHIARFWGLADAAHGAHHPEPAGKPHVDAKTDERPHTTVQSIITRALRAAGLMKVD
jgi:feruloyl esterase